MTVLLQVRHADGRVEYLPGEHADMTAAWPDLGAATAKYGQGNVRAVIKHEGPVGPPQTIAEILRAIGSLMLQAVNHEDEERAFDNDRTGTPPFSMSLDEEAAAYFAYADRVEFELQYGDGQPDPADVANEREAIGGALHGLLREAFPDFEPGTLPTPWVAGFEDTSWRNDTCPSFRLEEMGLCIWIDYADPAQREKPGDTRFALDRESGDDHEVIVATDDWQEILANALAEVHADQLRAWIPEPKWSEMRRRNAGFIAAGADTCASHDYCDANMAMDHAFLVTLGRSIFTPVRAEEGDCSEEQVEADCTLANLAWDISKRRHLSA